MPDALPNATPNPPADPGSSTPPSSAPIAPTEWRVPDNHPNPAFRGKTASELLGINDQMYGALTQLANQAPQRPAPPAQPLHPSQIGDDDVVDGRTMKAMMAQMANPVQQGFQDVYTNIAASNLETVRQRHADTFQKYGHEVNALLARVPMESRTLDTLEGLVKIVRSDHIDEIANERARELAGRADPTLRPSGGGGYGGSDPGVGRVTESQELPADYRQLLKDKGITEDTVREFCAKQGIEVQDWFKSAMKYKQNIITERSRVGG